ncbi:P-loop containing nucleoside triphosphate hydrolase protein [Roridomyces roridus]|uniref:P-loop containing nucleoside triphosphate hydrolase protein n=1 Tax=Roridomyces roridus TaxID=1738132 RepID=A0AAD7CAQ4_9AGAR|nr:P-loop containing nucleoside triphosphate hydrolase protein [Roridomyces roridus]
MDFTLDVPQAVVALIQLPDLTNGSSDVLVVPAAFAAISALLLLLHALLPAFKHVLIRAGLAKASSSTAVPPPGIGLGTILVYRIARLLGCVGLVGLSVASWARRDPSEKHGKDWVQGSVLILPYVYATILAACTIHPGKAQHRVIKHVNVVLFAAFCVYAYRDVFPLATYKRVPHTEEPFTWAKIALLFFTAVVVPVCTPRQYIPLDPLNPQKAINPEQNASIFSFSFFFFLDHIIFLAYRKSELKEDELYPLCDTDNGKHLVSRSFPHLDSFSGGKFGRRYIFLGLMRVFWREFTTLAFLMILRAVSNYSGPVAMNRLLQYIETGGQDAVVRPWVWISFIFLGPIFGATALQYYVFINVMMPLMIAEQPEKEDEQGSGSDSSSTSGPASRAESDTTENRTVTPDAEEENQTRGQDDDTTVQASSSSIKSATTSTSDKESDAVKSAKERAKKADGGMVGKINNLVTTDLGDNRDFLYLVVYVPLQLALGIWFLHSLLGWAVWVGLASIILLAPAPGYMAKLVASVQRERMQRTDGRVQSVSEASLWLYLVVDILCKIKLFGWEDKMKDRIDGKRTEELVWIRKRRILDLVSNLVNFVIPIVTMCVTYGCLCTLVMKEPLNASKVFSTMTVFDIIRDSIAQLTGWLSYVATAKVSLDRVDDFLKKTELLDAFDEKDGPVLFPAAEVVEDDKIGFRNATFTWSKETDGAQTPSRHQFTLRIQDEVLFQRGRINLIIGPTGSGKTSMLMALLGEMHWIPSSPDSWYNLPRAGGIAYAAQESWILNETIRDNITFDTPFDEERYKKVLHQCALEPDLALFQAGDETEVGEKGLTLSGGQKMRLTLARAVYSHADILLLDDVLAALDIHTSQWIVEKCFGGDLIQGRTIILVTHNVALTQPIADFVVTFGADGKVRAQGSLSELVKRGSLASKLHKDQKLLDKADQEVDPKPVEEAAKVADGKLILAEEVELGRVSSHSLKMYFSALSNNRPIFFLVCFVGGLLFNQSFVALRTWQLGYWARQYDDRPVEDVDVVFNLSMFVLIAFVSSSTLALIFIYLVYGQLRASKVIHQILVDSVLRAPLRWLDVTPSSRIIARVTNDIRAVDDSIPNALWPLAAMLSSMVVRFVAAIIYAPVFFFPGVAVGFMGNWIGQIYIAGQLPVKRHMLVDVSIRAFGAQNKFGVESLSRIDRYTRAARNYYNLNRWVAVRIEMLGALFAAGLATYLVYFRPTSAGDTGFALNMSISMISMLLWCVRILNDFEVQGNSLERIQGYIDIEHEKPTSETGKPPAYWPASGDLCVRNLSARYSEDSPEILHSLSFDIKSGERIGIVGRTGSGKSSLTLSLLRCIPTTGSVVYDGIETSELNLDALRSSITVIPQVPELLSGTLRANLDPFSQYDDADLNDALRSAGLFALQSEMDEGRITLDSPISSGGSNLSVGQRQIFALARCAALDWPRMHLTVLHRAIVRKSKILILDEATSAIDYKTDSIIQNSLRKELNGMVLDAGNIAEFDSPKELLKIEGGKLRALVDESGDRDILYAMANGN